MKKYLFQDKKKNDTLRRLFSKQSDGGKGGKAGKAARSARSERSEEETPLSPGVELRSTTPMVTATEEVAEVPPPSSLTPRLPLRIMCRIPISRLADGTVRLLADPSRGVKVEDEQVLEVPKAQVLSRLFDSGKMGAQSPAQEAAAAAPPSTGAKKSKKSKSEGKSKKSDRERRVSGSSVSSISTVSSRVSAASATPSEHKRSNKRSRKRSQTEEEVHEKRRRKEELPHNILPSHLIKVKSLLLQGM